MSRSLFSLSSARRSVLVVLGALLLALVLVVVASSALAPKKADAATQTVTKTFNNPAMIFIPAGALPNDCESGPTEGAADPYPSIIRVGGAFPAGSTITDVNLKLNEFTHTYPDDVHMLLSKGSQSRTVMSDVGDGEDVAGITLQLDDEAARPLPDEEQLTSGRFKPTNVDDEHDPVEFPEPVGDVKVNSHLRGFDGLSPNGKWKLRVFDDANGDCGRLESGWGLTIKASVP
jgi:hypothetical protein